MNQFRGYVDSAFGQLHYAEAGQGRAILLLHQTPRSHDEFAELQELLAPSHRTVAMDMLGFGQSAGLAAPQTIEAMADGALALLDALEIGTVVALGHHTGAVVAHELAARAPDRVDALVLSAMPWVRPERRAKVGVPVDDVMHADDGSHLTALWELRQPHYPAGRSDLLDRFVRDALAPGVDPAEGHRAVGRYEMERRVGEIRVPTLLIAADADPFSRPALQTVASALVNADVCTHSIPGGMIPLMEQCADEVAAAVENFLGTLDQRRPRCPTGRSAP